MDPNPDTKPQGAFSALLADQDLTHLERVLRQSLSRDAGGYALPPSYWRERLAAITRQAHLSHTQLQTVHRLYLYVDRFEAAAEAREAKRLADAADIEPGAPLSADA
ncbi:hypothetical protein [Caballeronia sp. GAWG1-1]|uniref:hypothetical protein n=1 Tax=Caballeronia sp. GAWG1-1 TaxID=2921742 RepID=UPI002028C015|nr:hypothetical protein [Caballeronia sp. GAWG1-1]